MTEVHMLDDSWATFGVSYESRFSHVYLQQTPEIVSDEIDFKSATFCIVFFILP